MVLSVALALLLLPLLAPADHSQLARVRSDHQDTERLQLESKHDQSVSSYHVGHPVRTRTSHDLITYLIKGVNALVDSPRQLSLFIRSTELGNGSDTDPADSAGSGSDNCTDPRHPPRSYTTSCDFVHAECSKKAKLMDYMAFIVCDLTSVQVSLT